MRQNHITACRHGDSGLILECVGIYECGSALRVLLIHKAPTYAERNSRVCTQASTLLLMSEGNLPFEMAKVHAQQAIHAIKVHVAHASHSRVLY